MLNPLHKKKKTKSKPKYTSTLSQPVEHKKKIISKIKHYPINNPITQIKFTTNKPKLKKPNTLNENNNLLYQTIKVLRERQCICNCHRNNCEHNNNKSSNQFRNINKEYHHNFNSNVFSEGTTLVSTHSTIFNKNIPHRDKIKYADKMRRSYSINSQNVNDNIECINNNNFNNGSLSHTLRHSNSMNHMINLNYVYRNNMRDNYNNKNNTNDIININEQQRNNYNNNNNNLYNSEQSDIVNQLYQEDELSPPVLNNNTKRILKRSASYNENINNEMSLNTPTRNKEINNESRNTFSFNPNDKDNNNNIMNNNNNNSVYQPPPFINEYPKDNNINNNISQSYSYRNPQQRSPSPINKLNISGSISPIKTSITPIHTRNIKYRSNSTSRATSQKAKHVNIMKDKIDMKAFEKDFRNINLNSFKTKLQTFLKNNNHNINKITKQ